MPIFSIGDSPDGNPYLDSNIVGSDSYFYGFANLVGSSTTSSSEAQVIVDISNCQSENKYFKIGLNAYSTYDGDSDDDCTYYITLDYSTRLTSYAYLAKTEDDIIYSTNSSGSSPYYPIFYLTGKD